MIGGASNARRRATDAVIAAVLFASAAVWGTSYWNASLRAGRTPAFYQHEFEPAVMLACGHGFRLASPQVPVVRAFLLLQRDRLSCSEIPQDVVLTDREPYQKPWLYLMATVSLAWRVLGISWSGLGPLAGLLFGATIAASYAIFRLGMGRIVSVAGAAALIVSSVHLQNLPHVRDYAKAPFTLALFAMLGLLVARPPTWRRLLVLAGAYGVTLGIGYGFRTDFLIDIPLFPIVVLAFAPGRVRDHVPAKLTAIAVCIATFAAAAWPILTSVRERGGCQWHAVLLGLTDEPTDALMVARAPYSFGHDFSDDFVYAAATAYAARTQPGVGHIEYCSPGYDAVTGRYLVDLARVFPGDLVTRGLASIVQIVQLPFRWFDEPLPGWRTRLYTVRRLVIRPLRGWGVLPVGIALLGLMAAGPRLGLFALFFLFYVGGYPALQFNVRHYFHLEFITWWAMGFVVQRAIEEWRAAGGGLRAAWARVLHACDWRRGLWRLGAAAAGILVAAAATRAYQQVAAAHLFQTYIDAPKQTAAVAAPSDGELRRVFARGTQEHESSPADLLEVDLDLPQCGPEPSIQFAYDRPFAQLTREYRLTDRSTAGEPTRVFQPIYTGFAGLRFSGVTAACLKGVSRVRVPEHVRLLLPATLTPSWRRQPMFERLRPWRWRW